MLKWFAGLTAGFVVLCAGIGYLDKRPASPSFTLGWHPPRLCLVCDAQATRNAGGTYSLYSPGNPVVGGTTISSSWANNTLADLSTEMTDSLSRSGKGGMLAALRGIDGTVASPAHSFTSEPGTGLYRIGAGDIGWSILGTKKLELTSSLFTITPPLTVSGVGTFNAGLNASTTQTSGWTASGHQQSLQASITPASEANGNDYPMSVLGDFTETNLIQLNARAHEILAPAGWTTWAVGLSYDVDASVGAGGQLWLANGAVLFGSPTAPSAKVNSSGLTVGASGTAIGASKTGTVSWTPGSVSPNTCGANTVSVTNLAFGDVCGVSPPSDAGDVSMNYFCVVSSAGVASIRVCNLKVAGSITAPAGTYTVRTLQASN